MSDATQTVVMFCPKCRRPFDVTVTTSTMVIRVTACPGSDPTGKHEWMEDLRFAPTPGATLLGAFDAEPATWSRTPPSKVGYYWFFPVEDFAVPYATTIRTAEPIHVQSTSSDPHASQDTLHAVVSCLALRTNGAAPYETRTVSTMKGLWRRMIEQPSVPAIQVAADFRVGTPLRSPPAVR